MAGKLTPSENDNAELDADRLERMMRPARFAATLGNVPPSPSPRAWKRAEAWAACDDAVPNGHAIPAEHLQALRETAPVESDEDVGRPLAAGWKFQELTARHVVKLRPLILDGDGMALMEAMSCCAINGLVAPGWLAEAFVSRYQLVATGEVASWSDERAFGSAVPTGMNARGLKTRMQTEPRVYWAALRHLAASPTRPIDKGFYEVLGEQFNLGATKAEELVAQYAKSSSGTYPTLVELKPYLVKESDLTSALLRWEDDQFRRDWLAAGGDEQQLQEFFGESAASDEQQADPSRVKFQ